MAEYTIQRGDNLTRIAKKYGTTVSALAKLNNISDPDKIYAGHTLKLPGAQQAASASPAAATQSAAAPAAQSSIPSDAELRSQAYNIYNPGYQQALDALTQSANTITTRYGRTVEDYGDYIDKTLKTTQRNIENSLLKRNMGRSSRAAYEITEGLADVHAEALEYKSDLKQDYEDRLASIATQKQTLGATKEQNIQSKIMELKQYYEGIRQFNEQMAFNEKQLALASKSGGSGGSSSGKSSVETALEAFLDKPNGSSAYNGASSKTFSQYTYPGIYTTPAVQGTKKPKYTYPGIYTTR